MADLAVAGIDFGTCWSSVVVRRADGSTERVKDPHGGASFSMPSSVADKGGRLVFGSEAHAVRLTRPYETEFKRRLGDAEITVGSHTVAPAELVGGFLGWLRDLAGAVVGEELAEAVITVPASYEGHRRGLMEKAAGIGGFDRVALLSEPEAAARHALAERPGTPGERVLVYDLGGGTFDVAVVRVGEGGALEVLAHDGAPDVGGIHFDREIISDIRAHDDAAALNEALQSENDVLRAKARLTLAGLAREFKHQLSFSDEHEGFVDPDNWLYELDRGRFESMIAPMLAETLDCCDRAVAAAELEWPELDRVILVGGSTRIPAVKDLVGARNPRSVQSVPDPELAVAEGAALPVVEIEDSPPEDKGAPEGGSVKRRQARSGKVEKAGEAAADVELSVRHVFTEDVVDAVFASNRHLGIAYDMGPRGAQRLASYRVGERPSLLKSIEMAPEAIQVLGRSVGPDGFLVGAYRGALALFPADLRERTRGWSVVWWTVRQPRAVFGRGDTVLAHFEHGLARIATSGPAQSYNRKIWHKPGGEWPAMAAPPDLSWYVHGSPTPRIFKGENRYETPLHTLDVAGPPLGFSVSPDGKELAVTSERMVEIFDPRTGKRKTRIAFRDPLSRAVFVPKSRLLAVGTKEGRVLLTDRKGKVAARSSPRLGKRTIRTLAPSPDGKLLMVVASGGGATGRTNALLAIDPR